MLYLIVTPAQEPFHATVTLLSPIMVYLVRHITKHNVLIIVEI